MSYGEEKEESSQTASHLDSSSFTQGASSVPTTLESDATTDGEEKYEEEEEDAYEDPVDERRRGLPPPSPPPPLVATESRANEGRTKNLLTILHQKEDVIEGLTQQLLESQEESDRLSLSLRQLLQERDGRSEPPVNGRKGKQIDAITAVVQEEKEGKKTNARIENVLVERMAGGREERAAGKATPEDAKGETTSCGSTWTLAWMRQRWEAERDGLQERVAGQERKIARLQCQLQQAEDEAHKREEVIAQLQQEVNGSLVEWENERRGATETAHRIAVCHTKIQHVEEEKAKQYALWMEERAMWATKERHLTHRLKAAERKHQKEWAVLQDEVTQLASDTQQEQTLQQMESERRVKELEASLQERTIELHTVEQKWASLQQQYHEAQGVWMEAKQDEKVRQRQREEQAAKGEAEQFRLQMALQQSQESLRVSEQQLQEMSKTLTSTTTILHALREELHDKEEEQKRLREATVERVTAFVREEETAKEGMLSQVEVWVKNREEMNHVVAAAEEKRRRAEEKAVFFQEINDTLRQTAQEQSTRAAEDILAQHRWAAGVMAQLQEQQHVLLRRWQEEEAKNVDLLSTVEVLTRIGEAQRQRQTAVEHDALQSKESWKESLAAQWKVLKHNQQLTRTLRQYRQEEKWLWHRLRNWQSDCWAMAKTVAHALGLSSSTSSVPPFFLPGWQERNNTHTFLYPPLEEPLEGTSEDNTTPADAKDLEEDDEVDTETETDDEEDDEEEEIWMEKERSRHTTGSSSSAASTGVLAASRILQPTVSTANKRVFRVTPHGIAKGRTTSPACRKRVGEEWGMTKRGKRRGMPTVEERKDEKDGKTKPQARFSFAPKKNAWYPPKVVPTMAAPRVGRSRTTSRLTRDTVPQMMTCMQHLLAFTVPHLRTVCHQREASEKHVRALTSCVAHMKADRVTGMQRLRCYRRAHQKSMARLHQQYRLYAQERYRQWWDVVQRAYTTHWMALFRGVPLLLSEVLLALASRLQREEAAAAAEDDETHRTRNRNEQTNDHRCPPAEEKGSQGKRWTAMVVAEEVEGSRIHHPTPPVWNATPSSPFSPVAECGVSEEVQKECDAVLKEICGMEGGWHSLCAIPTAVSSAPPPTTPPSVAENSSQGTLLPASPPFSVSSLFSSSSFIRHTVTSSILSFQWSPTQWNELSQFVHAALLRHMKRHFRSLSSSSSSSSSCDDASIFFSSSSSRLKAAQQRRAPFRRPARQRDSTGCEEKIPLAPSPHSIFPTTSLPPSMYEIKKRKRASVHDGSHTTYRSTHAVSRQRFVPSLSTTSSCPLIDIDIHMDEEEEEEESEEEDNQPRTALFPEEKEDSHVEGQGRDGEDPSFFPSSSFYSLVPPLENTPVLPSFLHPLLSTPVAGAIPTASPFVPLSVFKPPPPLKKKKTTENTKNRKTCRNDAPTKTENTHDNTTAIQDPRQEGELFWLLYRVMYHVVHHAFVDPPL